MIRPQHDLDQTPLSEAAARSLALSSLVVSLTIFSPLSHSLLSSLHCRGIRFLESTFQVRQRTMTENVHNTKCRAAAADVTSDLPKQICNYSFSLIVLRHF